MIKGTVDGIIPATALRARITQLRKALQYTPNDYLQQEVDMLEPFAAQLDIFERQESEYQQSGRLQPTSEEWQ